MDSDELRFVKVTVVINEENLRNLEDNIMDFDLTMLVDTDIDKTSSSTPLRMVKSNPVQVGPDVEEIGLTVGNYAVIAEAYFDIGHSGHSIQNRSRGWRAYGGIYQL